MSEVFNCPSCGGSLVEIRPGDALTRCPYCKTNVVVPPELRGDLSATRDPAQRDAASPAIKEIGHLLSSGRKIDAIRLYREVFDTGLKEAKGAVEMLEAGRALPIPVSYAAPQPPIDSGAVLDDIRLLLHQGKKIDAIKRYREVYSVGLKEAKDAVEAIALGGWSPPPPPPTFSGYRMEDSQVAHFVKMVKDGRSEDAIKFYRQTFDVSATVAREAAEKVLAGQTDVFVRRVKRPVISESARSDLDARPPMEARSGRKKGCRLALIIGVALVVLFFTIFTVILVMGLQA
jgi:ribosomal protein L7/L12